MPSVGHRSGRDANFRARENNRPLKEHFYGQKGSVEGLGYEIKGAFLPKQGEVHLPLAIFYNEGDLCRSLQHETLRHFGTFTFTGAGNSETIISRARKFPVHLLFFLWQAAQKQLRSPEGVPQAMKYGRAAQQ